MTPGPWSIGRLMGGFAVKSLDNHEIICEMRGSRLPFSEHKRNAEVISQLPDLVEMLKQSERYFGDLPSRDKAAMRMHAKITRMLNSIGIDMTENESAA